jgi:recombination protein RecR
MGALNPADGVEPRHLGLEDLVALAKSGVVQELVLALDPDYEGDGTALLLAEALRPTGIKITRLARGVPAGSSIEHLNRAVLQDALEGRRPLL